jgi:cytochrome c-type biogenesis protein CcmH/NrfG
MTAWRVARWIAAAPAVAAAAWLVQGAVDSGRAGEIAYDAGTRIEAWSESGGEPDRTAVEALARELDRAAALAPGDATVHELLGIVAERRIDRPGFLDEAIAHYERAVTLRPTSPYTWVQIAKALYRKGDTGPTFEAALRRAAELGPSEDDIQRTVVDYGLALWDEEAPRTRSSVDTMLRRAMQRDPAEILQIAERRGRLAVACGHLADAAPNARAQWLRWCEGRES